MVFNLERRSTGENATASQSEHLCRTNANLSDKGTARYPLARVRIRAGESLPEVFRIPRYSFRGWGCSRCNITTVGRRKKARRTDWSGQWRTSGRKRFTLLYIAAGIKESVCEPWNWITLKGYRVGATEIVPGRNSSLKLLFPSFGIKDIHKIWISERVHFWMQQKCKIR